MYRNTHVYTATGKCSYFSCSFPFSFTVCFEKVTEHTLEPDCWIVLGTTDSIEHVCVCVCVWSLRCTRPYVPAISLGLLGIAKKGSCNSTDWEVKVWLKVTMCLTKPHLFNAKNDQGKNTITPFLLKRTENRDSFKFGKKLRVKTKKKKTCSPKK